MYTPLYVKTNYSLLSSLITIDELIKTCLEHHLTSIAICDNKMYGAMEFFHKCQKHQINPVLGLEVTMEDGILLLYAKNYVGYQSLIKLSTIQSERMTLLDDVKELAREVIAIVPEANISFFEQVKNIISDAYLGFSESVEEQEVRKVTDRFLFIKEARYLIEEDKKYLPYLYRIRDGLTMADDIEGSNTSHALFPDIDPSISKEAMLKSSEIANLCQVTFPKPQLMLPVYACEKGMNEATYLKELSKAGLKRRLHQEVPETYQTRLFYELDIIQKMGFSNYFLVVYDFIKYAKQNKILVGPGRGSAAGSLVSYSLGITDIDPLKYDLLFERFLNPERVTMPDIDTDFPDLYRDQVIDYVVQKYGKKRVAGIITFGTLGVKQAIRDVSRVLNIPLSKVDALCKFIPTVTKLKLEDFYRQDPQFKAKIDSDLQLQRMFQIACKIEGYPRHISSHAAGIVLCEVSLDEIIPLEVSDGMYLTGYSMEYLEELGLLKMDFLGLKNLTTIMNILNDIYQNTHIKIDFNQIPMDDQKALEVFTKANTSGIFQFESAGMRNFLRKLKPTTFEDIFAAIALFRPGPAVNIDSYIRRKHGEEPITYLDPVLKPILENTYGIFIYQEQIMQVANVLAGYSLGEADILRRAMSKKKFDVLKNEEEKFVRKSVERGHDEQIVKEIFQLILNFAGYGFNRSHSVAYSIIAYKMAYLKAHYPAYFFSNLLTSVIGSEVKTNEYLMEVRSNHLQVLKPDITRSTSSFQVLEDNILFPLANIRGVGMVASQEVMKARKEAPFTDLFDTISRIYSRTVGRKTMENFILADAFSAFGYNKRTLIENLDHLINYAELTKDLDPSLVIKPEIEVKEEYSKELLLQQEKDLFGFYISNHPVSSFRLQYKEAISLDQIERYFGKRIETLIIVDQIKTIETKNKETMAFLSGSDETTSLDFVLFPKTYQIYSNIEKGALLKVVGTVEKRLDKMQIVVQKIEPLEKRGEEK